MANQEHVERLLAGVAGWNEWREENQEVRPDLEGAGLRMADLAGADLAGADLAGADLAGADLAGSTLFWADLSEATLFGADLRDADLRMADLRDADLRETNLLGADLTHAQIGWTVFGAVDLRGVQGLDTVEHAGPSTISLDTIERSEGQIPESFLRDCGVSDRLIEYIPSLTTQPIQYYSCFISYSSKDEALAKRLHADLQANGVRCWFAPHDLPIGARIRVSIDAAIRLHDKLLLILSKHSVASEWVGDEVEAAIEKGQKQKREVLFPIRCDTAVMKAQSGWAAKVRRTHNIGNFCTWKDHDAYAVAFARLLRDLRAGDGKG